MRSFPIMLDVRNRQTVVVGGGGVGLRKVQALLDAGAKVTLVSADRPDEAESLERAGVTILQIRYEPSLLAGAMLVFAATDDHDVNARIAADARQAGALINSADQPEDCDFYLPAVVSDGDVVIAIGSGGASPSLAGRLKAKIAATLPPRVGEFAAVLSHLREELKSLVSSSPRRMDIMKELSTDEMYRQFLSEGDKPLRTRLAELVAETKQ